MSQTPFSSPFEHESAIRRPLVSEPLSPVPVLKRVGTRNLKENNLNALASPFSSRPGSAASSPRGRSFRRPLHAKSRAVSAICKDNVRRKDYMRSRSAQDDWLAENGDYEDLSPGSVHALFYVDKPLSYSTPAKRRPRKLMELHGHHDGFFGSFLRNDPTEDGTLRVSVGETRISLPGTSPAQGANLIIRASRNPGVSPREISCPPNPALDLALELDSMSICGDPGTHSDQEPSASMSRARSQDASALTHSTSNKAVVRRPTRDRAGTIRASDFTKLGVSSSSIAPRLAASSRSNVRRTRSGTVVGPDSKLATNKTVLLSKGTSATGLAAVQSGSESESDDELLLKTAWIEDLEYLGLVVPQSKTESRTDELNLGLGGSRCGLKSASAPPRRLGLRRR